MHVMVLENIMKNICRLLCFIVVLIPYAAYAGIEMYMTPIRSHLSLEPNKSGQQVIELRNRGYVPTKFKVYVSGYYFNTNGERQFGSGPYTAEKWITINPKELTVNPHDFGVVRFQVMVPGQPAPSPGTYKAAVLMEQVDESTPKQAETKAIESAIKIAARLAHPISIDVGKPQYRAELESFKVETKAGQPKFIIRMRNPGSFDFPARGSIKIKSNGKKVKEITVPRLTAYRGVGRNFELKGPDDLAPGTYEAILSLGKKRSGGEFEAKATFTLP